MIVIFGFALYWFQFKTEIKVKTVDPAKITESIKYLESLNPPRIGKTPTDEEIYSSPYLL